MKKKRKPMKIGIMLLISISISIVLCVVIGFGFFNMNYRNWCRSYKKVVEKRTEELVQRINDIYNTDNIKNVHNMICRYIAGDSTSFSEPVQFYACLKDRETGEIVADSKERVYMAVPDSEAVQKKDDYLLMSYIYINEDAEFISWVKACLDEWRMKNDSSEYTIPPVRLETTKYDIVGDTSFIPYEVTAYEEDSAGVQKVIGYYYAPVLEMEEIEKMEEKEKQFLIFYGSDTNADDYPQITSRQDLIDSSDIIGWSALSSYQYPKLIQEYSRQSRYFWQGNYMYIQRVPFAVREIEPYSFTVIKGAKVKARDEVADAEGDEVSIYYAQTTAGTRDYVLEYYLKSNYWEARGEKILPKAFIIAGIVVLISIILTILQYHIKMSKYEKEMYRRTLMDSMSHDLKSPLTALRGYAESLKENLNEGKRESYVDAIIDSSAYIDRLINGNLELLRLEDMQFVRKKEMTDFIPVVEELFEKYGPCLEEKKVLVSIAGNYSRNVNKDLIGNALENLISNAVNYVEDNGKIIVSARENAFTISNTTNELPKKKPEELWNPFVKGNDSRTNETGSGIGLAIAKRIFDIHKIKAKIEYEDTQEKLFKVHLS